MTAAARRDQLLDIVRDLAGEQTFHEVSVEAVARRAGITRALVYQHFEDLQALLEAAVERETSRALAQVSETTLRALNEGDPLELMLESLRAYLHAVHSHPGTWRLVLMPPEGAPRSLHKRIAKGRATVLARLIQAVRPTLATAPQAPDAELTARVLSAISDEYARLVLTDPLRFPPDRLLEHARRWLSYMWIERP
ncbi:TetR/AcrR family transcriptional regulator [Streptosporangium sp. V21-05]|uniref:TetR/AcrR family transcriptional regulator n=1 Tax=Streptosporangium sp. V21-05 TaxID=3446115 RepID=UPI003F5356CF